MADGLRDGKFKCRAKNEARDRRIILPLQGCDPWRDLGGEHEVWECCHRVTGVDGLLETCRLWFMPCDKEVEVSSTAIRSVIRHTKLDELGKRLRGLALAPERLAVHLLVMLPIGGYTQVPGKDVDKK